MATLSIANPTLLDVAKRLDPDGKIDKITEILMEENEILDDMVWVEGNLPTGHRTTIRTGLPEPTWRKLYGGVQPTKSRTAQVTDTCGMLEAYAEVDKALADLNGNTTSFRMSEDKAHIQGMSHEFAASLFYATETTAPEEITGFAPRFSTRASTAANRDNIILQGGTQPDSTDNASIWLIGWGENTCHGIYPKGSKGGLQHTDKGQVTVENVDGSNGRAEMYRSHYRWDCGLTVRDWRYVVRIQYNQEDLTGTGATGPDLIDLMTQGLELPPSLGGAKFAWYMNRKARSFLRRQMVEKIKNSLLSYEMIAGKKVMMFGEIPVRRCDALLNTESGVPAS